MLICDCSCDCGRIAWISVSWQFAYYRTVGEEDILLHDA